MKDIDEPAAGQTPTTPRWVSWTLIAGAVGLLVWAWFIHGFLSEPSATGRVRLLLVAWAGFSGFAALLGLVAAAGGMRTLSWSRTASWVAGAAMTVTAVGAIAGLPALLGIFWSRRSSPN